MVRASDCVGHRRVLVSARIQGLNTAHLGAGRSTRHEERATHRPRLERDTLAARGPALNDKVAIWASRAGYYFEAALLGENPEFGHGICLAAE